MDETFLAEYFDTIERAARSLRSWSDERAAEPLREGGWSAKEVLGHLVDSATNNHGRFVRASHQEALVFAGYDPDAWVEHQGYRDADWLDLVELFERLNRHLCAVVATLPSETLTRSRTGHNLHEIAWQSVSADEPVTLEWFVRDYLGHLQHHLAALGLEDG